MKRTTGRLLPSAVLGIALLAAGRAAADSAAAMPSAAVAEGLRTAAEKGAAVDQLAYAKHLDEVAHKPDDARIWARKAADQGLADAWLWLGLHTAGDGAVGFYEKAAEGGANRAFDYLLDDLLFRAGDKADVAKAKHFADLARSRNLSIGAAELTTIDRCAEAGKPKIPAADVPSEEERKALAAEDCGSQEGVKRVKCLLGEEPRDGNALAEVYANGWGVKRSPRLAIALLCHASQVPAELEGMVSILYDSRDDAALDPPFRFCDHITSGMNQGVCAAQEEGRKAAERSSELERIVAKWTPKQQEAYRSLRKAAVAFFEERSSSEVDQSGTGHSAFTIEEEGTLEDGFLAALRRFEAHDLPRDADLAAADRALNAIYAQRRKGEGLDSFGTIKPDGIRSTQRAWIAYRDAWTRLAEVRYPNAPAAAVTTWCTTERTRQLEALAE